MTAQVLIVGCSTGVRDEIADCLREAGCTVRESEHAADALHALRAALDSARPFDIVIVDEALSGVDAQLFAELIREDERLFSTRLVLLTGDDASESDWIAAAGFVGQISSPVDIASLEQILSRQSTWTPIAGSDSPTVETGASGADATADVSILLVEDNEINMEVAREMIEKLGYMCDHVVNGCEAVIATEQRRYDLILMDCQMPSMDGYEATRRIRAREESSHNGGRIPIVAITAHAMKGDRERCLAVGMNDYLTKPVERARLAATIAKWLDQH